MVIQEQANNPRFFTHHVHLHRFVYNNNNNNRLILRGLHN